MRSGVRRARVRSRLTLADDLVAGREADEVREALDGDRVAVAHELGDRVVHRGDLAMSSSVRLWSGRRSGGPSRASRRPRPRGARPRRRRRRGPRRRARRRPPRPRAKIRSAVVISASLTTSAGDIRTLDLPHSRTSRPRSKQAHWTASACSAVSNSTPSIRPLPRTSMTSPSKRSMQRSQAGQRLVAARGGVVDEAALEQVDRRQRGRARDRVAAVGRAVRAGAPGLEQVGSGDHRAQRSCPTRCPWP